MYVNNFCEKYFKRIIEYWYIYHLILADDRFGGEDSTYSFIRVMKTYT